MKKLLVFAASILLSASSFAHLGNGSSGGGNIFGNQLNPWFLGNTEEISYCVEVSLEFSSIELSRIHEIVEESFEHWRSELLNKSGMTIGYAKSYIDILSWFTLDFQKACSDKTDVKIQLGFLTPDQKNLIPNHSQLLGMAYRESYDEVNLKGKGFIYIAPENGEDRPVSINLHPKPWSTRKNLALKATLIHELGHVFGLQDDYYSNDSLMSAGWVEKVTSKDFILFEKMIPPAFGCNRYFDGGVGWNAGDYERNSVRESLGLSSNETVYIDSVPYKKVLTIATKDRKLGKIQLNESLGDVSRPLIPQLRVYITNKQKVFAEFPEEGYNRYLTIFNSYSSIVLRDQIFELLDGSKMNVTVKFNQFCEPVIGAEVDGKFVDNIFM